MIAKLEIVIGPDPYGPGGVAWSMASCDRDGNWNRRDSGGWGGTGPRRNDPGAWLAAAKRHLVLPDGVRRWADADVTPYGWSQGAGHAPGGVRITWSF